MLNYKIGESYKIIEKNYYHYSILYKIETKYLFFDPIDTYNNNGRFLGKYDGLIIQKKDIGTKYIIEKLYNDENV